MTFSLHDIKLYGSKAFFSFLFISLDFYLMALNCCHDTCLYIDLKQL